MAMISNEALHLSPLRFTDWEFYLFVCKVNFEIWITSRFGVNSKGARASVYDNGLFYLPSHKFSTYPNVYKLLISRAFSPSTRIFNLYLSTSSAVRSAACLTLNGVTTRGFQGKPPSHWSEDRQMSDSETSKRAHHITGNLIKHMSLEQGLGITRPKNQCRGSFHWIIP